MHSMKMLKLHAMPAIANNVPTVWKNISLPPYLSLFPTPLQSRPIVLRPSCDIATDN